MHAIQGGEGVGTEGLHGSHYASSSGRGTWAMQTTGHANSSSGGRTWANQARNSGGGTWRKGGVAAILTGNNFGRGQAAPAAVPATTYCSYTISSTPHCTCRDLCSIRAACTSQLGQLEAKLVCIFAHMDD